MVTTLYLLLLIRTFTHDGVGYTNPPTVVAQYQVLDNCEKMAHELGSSAPPNIHYTCVPATNTWGNK